MATRDLLLDQLVRHRDDLSARYAEQARALGSPCFDGCHGCCHQLVFVELPDALVIARHLVAERRVTPELRRALEEDAARAEASSPADYFAASEGCVFLDASAQRMACTIYPVRPGDCRAWFIHGVPDGSQCAPDGPSREALSLRVPELEEKDVRAMTRYKAALTPGMRLVWVPLALGVSWALDFLERGSVATTAWRRRLDAASERVFAAVDESI